VAGADEGILTVTTQVGQRRIGIGISCLRSIETCVVMAGPLPLNVNTAFKSCLILNFLSKFDFEFLV
jgi:hypothetical protein